MKRWPERATYDPGQIVRWFENAPDSNIGIATAKGFIALDVDPRNNGHDSLKKLLTRRKLPLTARAITGSGGEHYLFRVGPSLRIKSMNGLMPGLDVKGEVGQFVVEPSVHSATGKEYVWVVKPSQIIADVPG
jgi:hypothetical protein